VAWIIWNLVSVHLEMVLVLVQNRYIVCTKCTIGSEIVLDTPKVLLGHEVQLEVVSVYLEIVLILMQDWCSVCGESTRGSEIILDAYVGTPR
jgi:hypothetical protein